MSFQFRHKTTLSLIVFFLLAVFTYEYLAEPDETLLDKMLGRKSEKGAYARQRRRKVNKEVFLNNQKVHLFAEGSEVILDKNETQSELVERLFDVTVTYMDMELKAPKLDYYWRSQSFIAANPVVTKGDGKLVSESLVWDQKDKLVRFKQVEFNDSVNRIKAVAGLCVFDPIENWAKISGNVEVFGEDHGTYKTDEEVQVWFSKGSATRLEGTGNQEFTFTSGAAALSDGPVVLDREKAELTLKAGAKPLEFKYPIGTVKSNFARLTWKNVDGKSVPETLFLEGDVRLENEGKLQYALADRVSYFIGKKETLLEADKGNRVLYFDSLNNFKVSAPKLIVNYHPQTGKTDVKGVGDVRFDLDEKELEQVKKRFSIK